MTANTTPRTLTIASVASDDLKWAREWLNANAGLEWEGLAELHAELAAEKKLSEAISQDCNNTALERNKLRGQLAAIRAETAKCGTCREPLLVSVIEKCSSGESCPHYRLRAIPDAKGQTKADEFEKQIAGGVTFIMGPGDDEGTRMVRTGTASGREEPVRLEPQYFELSVSGWRVKEWMDYADALAEELERVKLERDAALKMHDKVAWALGNSDTARREAEQRASAAEASVEQMREELNRLHDKYADEGMKQIIAMSDEQVAALCRLEGHDPADEAKIAKQIEEIVVLKMRLKDAYEAVYDAIAVKTGSMRWDQWQEKHAAPIARSRDE